MFSPTTTVPVHVHMKLRSHLHIFRSTKASQQNHGTVQCHCWDLGLSPPEEIFHKSFSTPPCPPCSGVWGRRQEIESFTKTRKTKAIYCNGLLYRYMYVDLGSEYAVNTQYRKHTQYTVNLP